MFESNGFIVHRRQTTATDASSAGWECGAAVLKMFLTTVLRASKPKTKNVLVKCVSVASGHQVNCLRERLADKMEFIRYDPIINMESLYREEKKLKSVKIILRHQKSRPANWTEEI